MGKVSKINLFCDEGNDTGNVRPGRSKMIFKIRLFFNWIRSWLYFNFRCPWVINKGMTRIPWSVSIWSPHRDVEIGDKVQFGKRCLVQCDIKFGNNIIIARNVSFVGRDDHRYDVVGKTIWDSPRGDNKKTIIEDDVWIGFGAIIIAGIRIGRGSVVGAGAVITRDTPRYSIVGGTPAKVIGWRFAPGEIYEHEQKVGYIETTSVSELDCDNRRM